MLLNPSFSQDSLEVAAPSTITFTHTPPPLEMSTTIAFLGATGGCGLSALARSLSASHTCHALCRTPSRLTAALDRSYPGTPRATLTITEGNAHNAAAVSKVLAHPADPARLVDLVVFTIGGAFDLRKLTLDDPAVCEKAMRTLLSALDALVGSGRGAYPRVAVVSSTGVSDKGRDFPLLISPVFRILLPVPHADKKRMEAALRSARATDWTLVRPALLKDGVSAPGTQIRVGVENLETGEVESREMGYFITRDDVGKWMFENLIQRDGREYLRKAVSLTS